MLGMTITGAKEFEKQLAALPRKMSKKIVRQAVRAGQKPILKKAKANASSLIGGHMGSLIAKSLKIKPPKKQRRGSYMLGVQVTYLPEFRHRNKDGTHHFIPAAIEWGHGDRKEQIARPFMRNAADSQERKAFMEFNKKISTGISNAFKGKS